MTVLRILVADDDDVDRRRVRRSLKAAALDCDLVEASTVAEMLSICRDRWIDCVIVDYSMPGTSGLDGIAALRERAPHLPIVMVTGQGDEIIAREALKRGAADYIPKTMLDGHDLRRTLERAMEKSALEHKLERRRKEQETFAYVLVHDLSAPIRSTTLAASMIKECLDNGDVADIGMFCDQIIGLANGMGALISDLHTHARVDENAALESFDAGDAVAAAIRNLGAALTEKRARVDCGPMPRIVACPPQIAQLLQNLIGNGVKYCVAATPTVRVDAERVSDGWRFAVTDNGIGVAPEYREQIFKPFERLHGGSEYPGSGLGLATCRKIVERHGGGIWCDAADSGGSVFYFTLPERRLSHVM